MPGRSGHREEWDDDEPWSDGRGADGSVDDDPQDEDPHEAADRARFSSEKGFCPECGAEIHDAADICPKCFSWIDGATHRKRTPLSAGFRTIVVGAILAALLSGMIFWLVVVLSGRT